MIRTATVTLSTIPAIAYRQKLPSGGSGVTLLRYGVEQPGIASISKTSGEAIPSDNTPLDQYPVEAFAEALALTRALPYGRRGSVKLESELAPIELDDAAEQAPEEEAVIVDSEEYKKIVEAYTDKTGKFSYGLFNKDLIRTAHQSSRVRNLLDKQASAEQICLEVVHGRLRGITKNNQLSFAQIGKMIELLDEVSPRGVLRELNDDIRRRLAAIKRR